MRTFFKYLKGITSYPSWGKAFISTRCHEFAQQRRLCQCWDAGKSFPLFSRFAITSAPFEKLGGPLLAVFNCYKERSFANLVLQINIRTSSDMLFDGCDVSVIDSFVN
jgi:hypothetical protein